MIAPAQIISRYRLEIPEKLQGGIFEDANGSLHGTQSSDGRVYVDNILDEALLAFREHYSGRSIVKDDIFNYVYGILHHDGYRSKYRNDLFKELPRIPLAPDFWAFAKSGGQLAELHANYTQLEGWEGDMKVDFSEEFDTDNRDHWYVERARWENNGTTLKLNEHITIRNIPVAAHLYKIAGRSPIQDFAAETKKKEYEDSGIINDRNDLYKHNPPEVLLRARQLIEVGIRTSEILATLPEEFE